MRHRAAYVAFPASLYTSSCTKEPATRTSVSEMAMADKPSGRSPLKKGMKP